MYNNQHIITKCDLRIRVKKLLLLVMRDRKLVNEYELLCEQLKVNLTELGEVRYTIKDNITNRELLKLLDIIVHLLSIKGGNKNE